jgi:acyl-CoA hydrolase/ADP-ribose pyrophosphatase YjhB (NUDIX family)
MDPSLNPALAEARFCLRCGKPAEIEFPRRIVCPHCGYAAYYNPKPVAAAIPVDGEGRVILLRRGFDPGRGLWTFPGGFVDLGESVEEAARRETEEELCMAIELGPLVGVYSRPADRVVLIVYRALAVGRPRTTPEAVEVRAFAPSELPWPELAFWSTELALGDAFPAWAHPSPNQRRVDSPLMDSKPASDSRSQLVRWMGVLDANAAGNVHGGTVMKLCDEAAALAAIKHSRRRVVTAAMDRMAFLYPIHVGELVTLSATVNAAWRTSMEVGVRVDAENPRTGELRHTNTAYLTMVALDDEGDPAAVPSLIAATPTEQRRMRDAELRRANRLAEREEIRARRDQELA